MTDAQLHTAVLAGLNAAADLCHQHNLPGITFVETAGGPASPAPSGSLQVRLCIPVILHCPFAPPMLISTVRRVLISRCASTGYSEEWHGHSYMIETVFWT